MDTTINHVAVLPKVKKTKIQHSLKSKKKVKKWEYKICDLIPSELKGIILNTNAHILDKALNNIVDEMPPETELTLDHNGIKGDSSWAGIIVNILKRIRKKEGILNNIGIGKQLTEMIEVHNLKNII